MLSAHPTSLPDGRIPVLISAHARDLVPVEAAGLVNYLESRGEPISVAAVAQSLRATRPIRRHRAVIRARDTGELVAGLRAVCHDAEHPLVARSDRPEVARTAFVFPGQGNHWPGMGVELLDVEAYREAVRRCDDAFRAAGQASPLEYLRGGGISDPVQVQAAQFSHAAALAATWRQYGVLPDVTVGHSLGELAAAYTAGAVDLDAAVAVVAARAELTAGAPGRFGMVMIGQGADAAAELAADVPGWLELSVVNGPESVVVSGELTAVRELLRRAGARGIFARELPVDYPAHTSALEPLREELLARLPDTEFHSSPVEFIGSVYGGPVPPGKAFGQYWFDNLRKPVRFDLATAAALARGVTTFIEMSAHPTLLVALGDTAGDAPLLGSTSRDQPAPEMLAHNITAAAITDPGYRWRDFTPADPARRLPGFPHAPMHATKLWATADPSPASGWCPQPPTDRDIPVTMIEDWRPAGEPDRSGTGPVAVIDYTGRSADLTRQLVAALGGGLVAPADAEQLILIAPPADSVEITVVAAAFADHARDQTAPVPGPRCQRVWLVTRGGEQLGADPPPRPGAAALAALHRSVGFGYPDQTFAHLDLPAAPGAADIEAAAAAFTLSDTEVAVRHGRAAVRRLTRCPAATAPSTIPDTVVITGGTGAIGLAYANYCAEHGARDITLLSRTGADSEELAALCARTGARIIVRRCDITDEAALRAVIAEHRPAPAGLLVHTASAPAVASAAVTDDAVADALGAKVIGLDQLVRHWPRRPDARILACSSVLALWGGAGHGLYAAANRMADALVGWLRADGLDASSIRWGLWQTVAVVSGEEKNRIARTGLTPMPPEAAITAGLADGQPDPVIFAADFDRLAVFFDSQGVPVPFEAPGRSASGPAGASLRPLPELVAAELAAVLGLPHPEDVDMHRSLVDLGLDSLLALDLRNRLDRVTGRRVALGPLLAGATGAHLVAVLGDDATPAATGAMPRQATERTVLKP